MTCDTSIMQTQSHCFSLIYNFFMRSPRLMELGEKEWYRSEESESIGHIVVLHGNAEHYIRVYLIIVTLHLIPVHKVKRCEYEENVTQAGCLMRW